MWYWENHKTDDSKGQKNSPEKLLEQFQVVLSRGHEAFVGVQDEKHSKKETEEVDEEIEDPCEESGLDEDAAEGAPVLWGGSKVLHQGSHRHTQGRQEGWTQGCLE